MPATDALAVRTILTEQFGSDRFARTLNQLVTAESERCTSVIQHGPRGHRADRARLALEAAETYYVSPDMAALARVAAQDFPDDETIRQDDPPSITGFILIPGGVTMNDPRGMRIVIHAVLWAGDRIWSFSDRNDPDDEVVAWMRQHEREFPPWQYDLVTIERFDFGYAMPSYVGLQAGLVPPDAEIGYIRDDDGTMRLTYDGGELPDELAEHVEVHTSVVLRFLLATWRLMQQTLTTVERTTEHPRPDRRRAQRARVPVGVTVISLRRRTTEHHGTGEPINYRTPVRGHWRRVWCGPAGDRYQRSVYVHPFWRGPEGAPIIVRHRINALTR